MKKRIEILKQVPRDFLALGSIPFFLLVLVRIWILDTPAYFSQIAISGGIILITALILKTNIYSGLALAILFFTSLVYNELPYTIFGSIAYLGLIASLFYLKYDKKKIMLGMLIGALASGISYIVVGYLFVR